MAMSDMGIKDDVEPEEEEDEEGIGISIWSMIILTSLSNTPKSWKK